MANDRIERLRGILERAAARDEELQRALEKFATDLLAELGGDAQSPAWAALKAEKGERQLTDHFVMQGAFLRGDLVFEVSPGTKLVMNLRMHTLKGGTHEVALTSEPSKSEVIDPPDAKRAAEARTRSFADIFAHLEGQVRRSVAFLDD